MENHYWTVRKIHTKAQEHKYFDIAVTLLGKRKCHILTADVLQIRSYTATHMNWNNSLIMEAYCNNNKIQTDDLNKEDHVYYIQGWAWYSFDRIHILRLNNTFRCLLWNTNKIIIYHSEQKTWNVDFNAWPHYPAVIWNLITSFEWE